MALLLCLSLPGRAIAQAPPCCAPPGCNLNCFGDMEAFASDAEMRQALCAAPANDPEATFEFNINNQGNSPCVFDTPVDIANVCTGPGITGVQAPQGNRVLSLLSGGKPGNMNKREGVAFPLCSPIQNGECVIVRFWASKPSACGDDFFVRLEFMPNAPVSANVVYWTPGGVSTPPTFVAITDNLPDFGLYEVTIQHPGGGNAWNYMLFSLVRSDSLRGRAVFDDIQVIRPEATFTQSVDCQTATFNAATDCGSPVTHHWDFGDGTTSNVANPTHYYLQSGNYTVTHTVSVTCNNGPQSDIEQQNVSITACPQELTCPCESGIIIDAKNGLPVSALGIDQLDLDQYDNCLAIKGNLIIDRNLDIKNGDIRMQPCSEITVLATGLLNIYPVLDLSGNTIYGCETMWKGIRVGPNTRLNFTNNTIMDAEYAISATGGSPFGFYPLPTRIQVMDNRFVKNHIGIYIPNSFNAGIVSHIPIKGNSFAGNLPGQTLLPPCNPTLPNYNTAYGYTGIASLFNEMIVGVPGDTGIANSFSILANGVIGEYSSLEVYGGEFKDIQAGWSNISFGLPSFAKSQGIGVLANGGSAKVQNSVFDVSQHGVYGVNNYNLRVGNNKMPSVGTGIESYGTYNLRVSDNPNIAFSRAGVKCRELRTGLFVSDYITGNKFADRTYPSNISYSVPFDYPAISISNGVSLLLTQARISGNEANLNNGVLKGIEIHGTGNWKIDDNHIHSTTIIDDVGFRLDHSNRNALYDNSVSLTSANNAAAAYEVKGGTDNLFCCNSANRTRFAHKFTGNCNPTDLRHSTMINHFFSVNCMAGAEIGLQYDKGNIFTTATSGVAFHGGTFEEISNSQFRVYSNQPPHYPAAVDAPNQSAFDPWFITNGAYLTCEDERSGICMPPGDLPPVQGEEENSERDLDVARGLGFSTDAYGAALLWEGQQRLYRRLKTYPELLGVEPAIDSFYQAASISAIGWYFEAEQAAVNVNALDSSLAVSLRALSLQINGNIESVEAKLAELAQAQTEADSSEIYAGADSLLVLGREANIAFAGALSVADSVRSARAQVALALTQNLPAYNLLQSNRKTVNRIYLETLAQGIVRLNAQQFADISAIAHQCMPEGGNAVLDARALYQLNEIKRFPDDTLCIPAEERKMTAHSGENLFDVKLSPNPAKNTVTVLGLPENDPGTVKVDIYNSTGHIFGRFLFSSGLPVFSVQELPEGIYFCRIYLADRPAGVKKLIILH